MNELLIKLDYYSDCCDKIEEYRGQLVANGLHEAMYMDIQVCVVKYGNRIPNSINIYCDGNHLEDSESCDISELLEIAKNRDPILFREYKELLAEFS